MAKEKKGDGFFKNLSGFFKRVSQQDVIKLGDNKINTYSQPASSEELDRKREMQVFRQFLQSKNWNLKHIELFDEYRRMDLTFPIINAALRLYAQEVCLTGDTIVCTPQGDVRIDELYKKNKKVFYVKSFNKDWNRVEYNMVQYVKNNGKKKVFEVEVERNIDPEMYEVDKKDVAKFRCTEDHKIMVEPGKFLELRFLQPGDVIWSMYNYVDPDCKCAKHMFNTTVIKSIKEAGEEDVYDLVDVSPNHHFLIKLTDTFLITVHNCTKDSDNNVIQIITDNKKVKKMLEECFYDNLKLNSTSYLHVRSMLKFGNHFSFIETRRGVGVIDLIPLPPEAIRIQLLQDSFKLDDFKYHWWGQGGGIQFEPWEVVHWKNIEDLETEPYGQSILRSIVDTYRRIVLMREAMIVYRITRAPQRFLFKIDTTGVDPDGALKIAEDLKKQMYKKPLINPVTGELDHKYNTISVEENLYMPSYEGDTSDVRVLEGASNLGDVEDYKIIKDDLFAGLLIPKSYLTFEEDLCLRGNTKLLTNEGMITIEELSENMKENPDKKIFSLSCNKYGIITSGKILWCKKTKSVQELHRITVNDRHVIETTDNHPFLMDDLQYKRADTLQKGDLLKNMYDEEMVVTNVEVIELDEIEFVYDLEVEEYHNFALESGVFVHNSNKAALAQEDLRFAGAIKQYQAHYIEGLLHIALVHLHMNGCSSEELGSFELQMNTNSTLAEKTRNELLGQRFDLAMKAWNPDQNGLNFMSFTQVLKEILHFTDEEVEKTIQDQLIEKRIAWRMNKLSEDGIYHDPDAVNRKTQGLDTNSNIFANLTFESAREAPKVMRSIISEQVDKEIAFLTRKVKAKPTHKLIENVMSTSETFEGSFTARSLNKSKIMQNIRQTEKDLL